MPWNLKVIFVIAFCYGLTLSRVWCSAAGNYLFCSVCKSFVAKKKVPTFHPWLIQHTEMAALFISFFCVSDTLYFPPAVQIQIYCVSHYFQFSLSVKDCKCMLYYPCLAEHMFTSSQINTNCYTAYWLCMGAQKIEAVVKVKKVLGMRSGTNIIMNRLCTVVTLVMNKSYTLSHLITNCASLSSLPWMSYTS